MVLFSQIVFWANCSKDSTEPEQEIVFPDSNLSFSKHIHPLFLKDCAAGGNCHQSIDPAAGLDLETSNPNFINNKGEKVVIPGDPENSLLFQVLVGAASPPMPYRRPPLEEKKILAIRTWIAEGARIDN